MKIEDSLLVLKKDELINKLDPADLAVREKGPFWAFFTSPQKHSITCIDKNRVIFPSEVGKTSQQKRHLLQDAFLNGGAAIFDGARVLRTPGGDAQFPVYQAINRQKTGI